MRIEDNVIKNFGFGHNRDSFNIRVVNKILVIFKLKLIMYKIRIVY